MQKWTTQKWLCNRKLSSKEIWHNLNIEIRLSSCGQLTLRTLHYSGLRPTIVNDFILQMVPYVVQPEPSNFQVNLVQCIVMNLVNTVDRSLSNFLFVSLFDACYDFSIERLEYCNHPFLNDNVVRCTGLLTKFSVACKRRPFSWITVSVKNTP